MVDVIKFDMQTQDVPTTTDVAYSSLGLMVRKNIDSNTAGYWGKRLQRGTVKRLYFPMNVVNIHWISIMVDVLLEMIAVGDSYPAVTAPHIGAIISDIRSWLKRFFPSTSWRIDPNGIPGWQSRRSVAQLQKVGAAAPRASVERNMPGCNKAVGLNLEGRAIAWRKLGNTSWPTDKKVQTCMLAEQECIDKSSKDKESVRG
ncbi:hypothetical protein PLICRDRAFT_127468 [Plicaturopsis crispa FD-325 SS-3]|uniref:Ubiquitin-like protease family profile domain-containing protein n=1 Tax=Plicaturopsis crispa FD-325 SS-3 TaxID=944288 RepID=A0A0C9T3W0_PLICR|nr:hypothetical protein PLICRDRAFT_127468 [Plicaturopsis crispa FD-325 SS-3]